MAVVLAMATCPNCGAPHDVDPRGTSIICIYCNTSLRVQRAAAAHGAPGAGGGAAATITLSAQAVPKEEIERVKQLLVDGKREEAIAHYMRVASASRDEAERAIADMVVSSFFELTARLPINAVGFLMYAVRVFGSFGVAAWAASQALESPGWWALVAAGIAFALFSLYAFFRHLKSTLVCSFGAVGRGRILRRAVLRNDQKRGAYLIAVMFEVAPDDGGPPFVDQENLFVGAPSFEKLSPGNVVRVRFDGARTLVFPDLPITVIATAAAA